MSRGLKLVLALSLLGNLSIAYVGYKAWEYRSHINHFRDKYLRVIDEFSQRDFYRAANDSLPPPSPARPRIILFGTQVMARWPAPAFGDGFEIVNRGVTGQRAAGFLLRFKSDVLDLRPSAVIIEISSYNLRPELRREEIQDYVVLMAGLARLHGIEPILTTPVPLLEGADPVGGYALRDSLTAYCEWVRAYADVHSYRLLDMAHLLADERGHLRSEWAQDAIDPDPDGYRILSRAAVALLDSVLIRADKQ